MLSYIYEYNNLFYIIFERFISIWFSGIWIWLNIRYLLLFLLYIMENLVLMFFIVIFEYF